MVKVHSSVKMLKMIKSGPFRVKLTKKKKTSHYNRQALFFNGKRIPKKNPLRKKTATDQMTSSSHI